MSEDSGLFTVELGFQDEELARGYYKRESYKSIKGCCEVRVRQGGVDCSEDLRAELTRLKAVVEVLEGAVERYARLENWNGREVARAAQLRVKEIREGKNGA